MHCINETTNSSSNDCLYQSHNSLKIRYKTITETTKKALRAKRALQTELIFCIQKLSRIMYG